MLKKLNWLFILVGAVLLFFYPVLLGKIPFPGDLLISEYSPWKYFSFLGYLPGSYPEKFQYFDVIRQIYPWTTFTIESLKSFQFPLWNPYNFAGSPLFANSQSAVLYPLHILYFIFPQEIAWTLLVMSQPFLIGIFTYLFARKIGIGKWGGIFASIAFGFSLFVSVFLEYNTVDHVIIFLPFLLWLTELLFEKKTALRVFGFVGGIAAAAFAGHIQIFGFVLLFVLFYIVWKLSLKKSFQSGLFFLVLSALGIGVALIQLIPTFELIHYAARGSQEYSVLIKNLLLQWYQSLLFFSPDIFGNPATKSYLFGDSYPGNAVYIGLVPFIFSFVALYGWKKEKFIRFFSISSATLLVLFFNSPATQLFYKFPIPFFSTGSPTNAIFLLSFSLSILAGFGIEHFLVEKNKKTFIVGISSFIFFCVFLIVIKLTHTPFIFKNIIYTLSLFIVFLALASASIFFSKKKLVLVFLLILTVGDLFYFSHKFNPFVNATLVFPETQILSFLQQHARYDRFWSYGNAEIQPNFATQYKLFDPNGYDPLYPKTYGIFISSAKDGKLSSSFSDINRSDAMLPGVFTAEDLLKNKHELKVLNLLGVRYLVSKADPTTFLLPTDRFKLVFGSEDKQVFENTEALPRVFLVYQTIQYYSDKQFSELFYADSFNPQATVLLNKNISLSKEGFGSAKITSYAPNRVSVKTTSTEEAVLVLTDSYFPGWKVAIDGKQTDMLRADFAFRGVKVPKGVHTVVFTYQPYSFSLGLALSILSIGLMVVAGFALSKRNV